MFRPMHALGVMAGQLQDGTIKPSEFAENMTSMISQALTPFDATSFTRSFVPTSISPIVDIIVGTDFMDIPLQKEMYTIEQEKNTKELHKAKPNTAPIFTKIARGAARLAGFDPDNPGKLEQTADGSLKKISWWLDLNPTHLEHVLRGYTGGIGKFVIDTYVTAAGLVEAGLNEESKGIDLNRVSIVNRIYNQPRDGSYDERRFWQMKHYLDDWDEVDAKNREEGKKIKTDLNKSLRKLYIDMDKLYSKEIEKYNNKIKDNRTRIDKAKDNLDVAMTTSRKLDLKNEIKRFEKEIEEFEKNRLRGYRKAVKELKPKFDELKIDYSK
jgi:hypothetical protein